MVRTLKALKVSVEELDKYIQNIPVYQPRFPTFQHYKRKYGVEMKFQYLMEIKPHLSKGKMHSYQVH